MKSEDHAAFESQMRKYYKRSTSTGVSSMNRETEVVEKWKESELQGTGTVKLGTSDRSSGSHHSGAPAQPEPCARFRISGFCVQKVVTTRPSQPHRPFLKSRWVAALPGLHALLLSGPGCQLPSAKSKEVVWCWVLWRDPPCFLGCCLENFVVRTELFVQL